MTRTPARIAQASVAGLLMLPFFLPLACGTSSSRETTGGAEGSDAGPTSAPPGAGPSADAAPLDDATVPTVPTAGDDSGADVSDAGDAGDGGEYYAAGPCGLGDIPDGATVVDLSAVSLQQFASAISAASAHFATSPDDTYVIRLGAGTFDLSQQVLGSAAFDVTGIAPRNGRLIITGAGRTLTTLVLADHEPPTGGANAAHVCFVGMKFTKAHYSVSQGHVVSVDDASVVLDIQDGFPSPADLYTDNGQGYFLRKYTDDTSDPELTGQFDLPDGGGNDNPQIPWTLGQQVSGNRWQLEIDTAKKATWAPGDLLGIKAEPGVLPDGGTGPGGGAGTFQDSSDIVFNDVTWTLSSRVEFQRTNGVQILNSSIERSPPINGQTPCLSVPGGGPQINSGDLDGGTSGHVIANFVADSTGDDSIAFFRGAAATILDSQLRNSFSKRCINSNASPAVTVDDFTTQHTTNCRIVFQ